LIWKKGEISALPPKKEKTEHEKLLKTSPKYGSTGHRPQRESVHGAKLMN
jgi:hypothetical protein